VGVAITLNQQNGFGQTLGVVGDIAVQRIRRRMMVLVCYNCCG
jgi:hypothetical protein